MKLALVITVKNEERILRNNFLYHYQIGVDKIFVYFDGSTDFGRESVSDLKFVEVADSVSIKDYYEYEFLDKFTSQGGNHHTARQCLNTFDASQKAEKEGFDWLISIDADELVASSENDISNLKSFFSNIGPSVDAVNFKVKEVLQAKKRYNNVFAEETRFKTIRSFKRYSENIFRTFHDPSDGKYRKFVYWYGHNSGKSAIRLNRGIIPVNPHRYMKKNGGELHIKSLGLVLHYHAYDAADFIKKYKNFEKHPNNYLSGKKVEDIKLLFISVVNRSGLNEIELEDYFEKFLMFKEEEISNLKANRIYGIFPRKKPVLVEINGVAKVFKELLNA